MVFSVDANTLPLVSDLGVEVPEVLVDLRDMLMLLDPMEEEGIFRKAGNEVEMKRMIDQFNKGLPVQCVEVHSVATLIKVSLSTLFIATAASNDPVALVQRPSKANLWDNSQRHSGR